MLLHYRFCKLWVNHIIQDAFVAVFVMSVLMECHSLWMLIIKYTVSTIIIVCLHLNVLAAEKVNYLLFAFIQLTNLNGLFVIFALLTTHYFPEMHLSDTSYLELFKIR